MSLPANNFQRIGAISNSHVGNVFEVSTRKFFEVRGIELTRNIMVSIGVGNIKKSHRFDLGSENPAILVECKSHTWTQSGNMPSAKMTVWNEAMYYFLAAPNHYRKILFVLKDVHPKKGSLAAYYLRTHAHLIPDSVEIWEFDPVLLEAFELQN